MSHDRHFLDILAERVLEIRNGKLYDYPGNYSWFLEKREELLETEHQNLNLNLNIKNNSRNDKLIERQERQRILNETRGLRKNISELESKINKLESGQAQIDLDLCSPEVLSNSQKVQELMQQRNFNAKELEQAYADWENLNYELENYK